MNILDNPSIQSLRRAYADQDRTYAGVVGDYVLVTQKARNVWEIIVCGIEAYQRDAFVDDLRRAGVPQDEAVWIAGQCQADLLPDADAVSAMNALEGMDDHHYSYFDEGGRFTSYGSAVRASVRIKRE